MEAKESQQIWQ